MMVYGEIYVLLLSFTTLG